MEHHVPVAASGAEERAPSVSIMAENACLHHRDVTVKLNAPMAPMRLGAPVIRACSGVLQGSMLTPVAPVYQTCIGVTARQTAMMGATRWAVTMVIPVLLDNVPAQQVYWPDGLTRATATSTWSAAMDLLHVQMAQMRLVVITAAMRMHLSVTTQGWVIAASLCLIGVTVTRTVMMPPMRRTVTIPALATASCVRRAP